MRSPLTGMIFALELSHDLNTLPALLIACVASLAVTVLLLRRSILTEKLARRGQHIAREYSVDLFELMRVAEVMDKNPPMVTASTTIAQLSEWIANGDSVIAQRQGTLILNEKNRLCGIITRGDVLRALQRDRAGEATVLQAGQTQLIVTYPDEPLRDALEKIVRNNIGRLPVVDRTEPDRVLGYLGRSSILSAGLRQHEEEELRHRGPIGIPLVNNGARP